MYNIYNISVCFMSLLWDTNFPGTRRQMLALPPKEPSRGVLGVGFGVLLKSESFYPGIPIITIAGKQWFQRLKPWSLEPLFPFYIVATWIHWVRVSPMIA